MSVRAVIFDLGEVLVNGMRGAEERLAPFLRLPPSEVKKQLNANGHLGRHFRGEITEERYWRALITDFSWPARVQDLKRLMRENFQEVPGMRAILENLARRYKLGLLSDIGQEWAEYSEAKFGYAHLFSAIQYSYQVGFGKPCPEAYTRLLSELGVLSYRCMFIDDKERNVTAARQLGMLALQFTSTRVLWEVLRRMGLLEIKLLPAIVR